MQIRWIYAHSACYNELTTGRGLNLPINSLFMILCRTAIDIFPLTPTPYLLTVDESIHCPEEQPVAKENRCANTRKCRSGFLHG